MVMFQILHHCPIIPSLMIASCKFNINHLIIFEYHFIVVNKAHLHHRPLAAGALPPAGQGLREAPSTYRPKIAKGGMLPALRGRRDTRDLGPKLRSEEHTSELQSLTNLVCRLQL